MEQNRQKNVPPLTTNQQFLIARLVWYQDGYEQPSEEDLKRVTQVRYDFVPFYTCVNIVIKTIVSSNSLCNDYTGDETSNIYIDTNIEYSWENGCHQLSTFGARFLIGSLLQSFQSMYNLVLRIIETDHRAEIYMSEKVHKILPI